MKLVRSEILQRFVQCIFEQAGASADNAFAVAQHLVDANLAGHDSHGIIRVPSISRMLRAEPSNLVPLRQFTPCLR